MMVLSMKVVLPVAGPPISASGDIGPCVFAHFATDNIRGMNLEEDLQNPLFKAA